MDIPVEKRWSGLAGTQAVVHLYADGVDTGLSAVLDANNNWQHTFTNLELFHQGVYIQYSIVEDPMAGYTVSITGDATTGFVVTNTKDIPPSTPKTSDTNNLSIYAGMLLMAVLVGGYAFYYKQTCNN